MRLTLRTMLAYLDGILEPTDRDEIERKIKESPFATQLVERIGDCTRRLRLGAPKLSGKGVGLDPNTVAEYLDNTLAGERVPDFEKVCLESEIHLAEVASCHQILAMVLGQPAEIDPAAKRRMYSIADHAETAKADEDAGVPGAVDHFPPHDEGIVPARRKPEIPEYLRAGGSRSRWRAVVAAIALLLLLCGAITLALGPLDGTNPVLKLFGVGQPAEKNVAQNDGGEKSGDLSKGEQARPEIAGAKSTVPDATATVDHSKADNTTTTESPKELQPDVAATGAGAASTPADSNSKAPDVKSNPADMANTVGAASPMENSTMGGASMPAATDNATAPPSASDVPGAPQPPGTGVDSSMSGASTAPAPPVEPGRVATTLPPQNENPAGHAPGPVSVLRTGGGSLGRYVPGRGIVLLRLDRKKNEWTRLPAVGAPLSAGDMLLVLPTFRPTVTLSAGITLQIPSETLLELMAADADGAPGVKLHSGRLIVMTSGQTGSRLRLDLGTVSGEATFADADAILAVEVRRYHVPGADPEAQEPRIAADLYAASGKVDWTGADGKSSTITAPQRVVLAAHPGDPATAGTEKQIPKWVGSEQMLPLNALAADALFATISDESQPLLLELRQMADHRRVERRSIAAQCMAMLDEFEPLIRALGDENERGIWLALISDFHAALARGPATAAKVREAYQKQRGQEAGQELYRMLWGYTKEQLQGGEAAKLVGELNHDGLDNLDFRVVACADLQDIMHPGQDISRPLVGLYDYRPDAPAASREGPVMRWQELLRKGQIVPREAAPPVVTGPATPPAAAPGAK